MLLCTSATFAVSNFERVQLLTYSLESFNNNNNRINQTERKADTHTLAHTYVAHLRDIDWFVYATDFRCILNALHVGWVAW